MSQELFYTSAPAGLKPGSKGFCTVAMTAGMSGLLMQRLEMLSSYREVFPAGDPQAAKNPVAWSHWRLSVGDRPKSVLSRICSAGMDYTQRANILAHHIVLEASEQFECGPAWMLSQPGLMESQWNGPPRLLPRARAIPAGNDTLQICTAWEAATGDAGWAGTLAETASGNRSSVAYIIYAPGDDVLPLIREAMTLLSPQQRWQTTFCSYFTELPAGLNCTWRCCVAGTAAAKEARRYATSGVVIDLTQPGGTAPESPLVWVARSGKVELPQPAPALTHLSRNAVSSDNEFELETSEIETESVNATAVFDQSWMPPVSATIVESEADSAETEIRPASLNSRKISWLIAIIWPIFLVSGVVLWHITTPARNEVQINEDKKAIEDLKSKAAEQTASFEEVKGNLSHANQLNQDLKSSITEKETALSVKTQLYDETQTKLKEATTERNQLLLRQISVAIATAFHFDIDGRGLLHAQKDIKIKIPTIELPHPETAQVDKNQMPASLPSPLQNEVEKPTPQDKDLAQLWVTRNLFGPDKVLYAGVENGEGWTIRLLAPGSPFHASTESPSTSIAITDQTNKAISWLVLSNGELTYRNNIGGPPSTDLQDWLRLSYVQLQDHGKTIALIRLMPEQKPEQDKKLISVGDLDINLPDFAKKELKNLQLFQASSPGWQFFPNADGPGTLGCESSTDKKSQIVLRLIDSSGTEAGHLKVDYKLPEDAKSMPTIEGAPFQIKVKYLCGKSDCEPLTIYTIRLTPAPGK
jgi:hypothetical protein